ncbi:MAG: hypothetical protein KKB82_06200 [Candidatus Omnitrophica bacterium]|nr:hypothetical protein [Candidatus Omnitrophota bacterium]MBU1925494.1 hypothetical protein [Candidatus Omnitrophota bacterium]MBU2062954.1 hypothetical protein [Candidatus Omnitrophota bacterium]
MKSILIICKLFLLCVLFISGCGYTTKASFLPRHITSIYIDNFRNNTDQPNLENEFRPQLISFFQKDGNLKIAALDDASSIVRGKLVGYSRDVVRYAEDDVVRQYRLTIAVDFEFVDLTNNEVKIEAANFTGDTEFFLTGSSAKTEESARKEALEDLAKNIVNKVITLW